MTKPRHPLLRKLDKLRRDPAQFAQDLVDKRLRQLRAAVRPTAPGSGDVAPEPEPAPRDFITPLTGHYEALIAALLEHNLSFQEVPAEHGHVRRLAVRVPDVATILEIARALRVAPFELVTERESAEPTALVRLYFRKAGIEYRNPTIELDPWIFRGGVIRSTRANPLTSWIPEREVNRTVYCLTPRHLNADEEKDLSFVRALELDRSILNGFPHPIDVVYTWVDDRDPAWRARKQRVFDDLDLDTHHPEDVSELRYRNRDELRYSLRSVASFFPFARKIFLVTDAQRPPWLDVEHERIELVDHRDVFPNPEHLPTFNSHSIETHLFHIDGLAEHFLYLNDDFFFLNPCSPADFFFSNGISKSFYEPIPTLYGAPSEDYPAFKNAALNGARLLMQRFGASAHNYLRHTPVALKKSVGLEMWREFEDAMTATSASRVRSATDISTVSFLYHYYSHLRGASVPATLSDAYVNLASASLAADLRALARDFDTKVLCLNDVPSDDEATKDRLVLGFLRARFPAAAPWELDR